MTIPLPQILTKTLVDICCYDYINTVHSGRHLLSPHSCTPQHNLFCLQINPRRGIVTSEKWIPVRSFREKHQNGDLFNKSSGSPRILVVQDHERVPRVALTRPVHEFCSDSCLWAFDKGVCCRFQMTKGQSVSDSVSLVLKDFPGPVVCTCLGWVCSWHDMYRMWKRKAPGIKSSFWSQSKHWRQNFAGLNG